MSSTLTKTELEGDRKPKADKKTEERREKLTRSASIDKINSYICSQNYYFLNAILYWLKTSQTILQKTVERGIFRIKSFVYGKLKALILIPKKVNFPSGLKKRLFALMVYVAIFTIFTQLAVIVYVLCNTFLPLGLVFLLSCLYLICHVQVQILFFYCKPKEERRRSRLDGCKNGGTILKPKQILGNRTISNLQLF